MPTTAASSTIGRPQRFVPTSAEQLGHERRRTAGGTGPCGLSRDALAPAPDERRTACRAGRRGTAAPCRWSGRSPTPIAIGHRPDHGRHLRGDHVRLGVDERHDGRERRRSRSTSAARPGRPSPTRPCCATLPEASERRRRLPSRAGLLDQGREVVQPGDLGVHERRAAEPADHDHPVLRDRSDHHASSRPNPGTSRLQVDPVGEVERGQPARAVRRQVGRQGGRPNVSIGAVPASSQQRSPSATGTRPGTARPASPPRAPDRPSSARAPRGRTAARRLRDSGRSTPPGRRRSVWQAVTMVSGSWLGGRSTMKSSTTTPSPLSTISTALMSRADAADRRRHRTQRAGAVGRSDTHQEHGPHLRVRGVTERVCGDMSRSDPRRSEVAAPARWKPGPVPRFEPFRALRYAARPATWRR